jgi:hypothetical protein
MWPQGPPSTKEILKISRRTTDIIQSKITSNVCLFGSAAAYLWADPGRVPNVRIDLLVRMVLPFTAHTQDVDIVVNASYDAEKIKEIIVETDSRYFLKPARQRDADYEVLFCRLPGWHRRRRCVKVDILVPPSDLGLPEILASDTPIINDIPVMPLFALLVMKTQGWWDHRVSPREDFRAKEDGDVDDVDALLDHAADEDVDYEVERASGRYTSEFMDKTLLHARRFVSVLRGRREKWKAIGFPL